MTNTSVTVHCDSYTVHSDSGLRYSILILNMSKTGYVSNLACYSFVCDDILISGKVDSGFSSIWSNSGDMWD